MRDSLQPSADVPPPPTDLAAAEAERFPGLSAAGRAMLERLRTHPHAPRYTAASGHRLTPEALRAVRAFEAELRAAPPGWAPGAYPAWLADFVAWCFREVPFYRRYGEPPARFEDIPVCDRSDLSREPWAFVPDDQPLAGLIVHATSGTTGHPLKIISHPLAGGLYTPLIKAALEPAGVRLSSGAGDVACVLVGWQRQSFTYPSVTPQQGEAGHLKLNLHPDDWRHPDDRVRFLDNLNPEIYTGDPVAFAELMQLPLRSRPKALVSTAMALLPGLRRRLQERFGCPVVDLYSMNESGPIAARAADGPFALLHHRLYVEVLDAAGAPAPAGGRGEVVLTGGFNPFLPLLRYRTNDHAALAFQGRQPLVVDLEGRPPVLFRAATGGVLNTLDVTAALKPLALPQFQLHQAADGALRLRLRGAEALAAPARAALLDLFGQAQALTVESLPDAAGPGDKVMQYTSELPLG
ncbi:MAG: hypothetical protein JNK29_19355 [Anaerolineales bacterium]|nr:hypothetical protein [Anaerolineales bacterium]